MARKTMKKMGRAKMPGRFMLATKLGKETAMFAFNTQKERTAFARQATKGGMNFVRATLAPFGKAPKKKKMSKSRRKKR